MTRHALRVQFILCGEVIAYRMPDGELTSRICAKPASVRIRWSDGSATYCCECCAAGPMRRDEPVLV